MAEPPQSLTAFLRAVRRPVNLPRLAFVAAVPIVALMVFAITAGWIPSSRMTQQKITQIFDKGGAQPGFRMNHARGLCATGWFSASGAARDVSDAPVFHDTRTQVVARFSLAGSMPTQADAPTDIRSLSLRLVSADGQDWRTAMIVLPIFPAPHPEEFVELTAVTRPVNGKPDAARVQAFMAAHPDVASALAYVSTHTQPAQHFSDAAYNALNTFYLTHDGGARVAVRWSVRPDAENAIPDAAATGADYQFSSLARAFAAHPLRWHLILTLGNPGDPTADPSKPWPDDRRQIDAGVLTLDQAQLSGDGPCTDIVFDPTMLPHGIALSDDPYPAARSAAYMRSYVARSGSTAPAGERPDVHAQRGQP